MSDVLGTTPQPQPAAAPAAATPVAQVPVVVYLANPLQVNVSYEPAERLLCIQPVTAVRRASLPLASLAVGPDLYTLSLRANGKLALQRDAADESDA